jgi:hypothetical protein
MLFGMVMVVSLLVASGTAFGAALNVVGGASPVHAAAGNSNNALLLVSVTDTNGQAVQKLDADNFKVDASIVGPGGALVDITRADENPRAIGFYIVEIVPTSFKGTQYTWVEGIYLFAVTVKKGEDRGQTVIPMTIGPGTGSSSGTTSTGTSELGLAGLVSSGLVPKTSLM